MAEIKSKHPLYQTDADGLTKVAREATERAKIEGPFDHDRNPIQRCRISGLPLTMASEVASGMHHEWGPGSLRYGEAFPSYVHPDPGKLPRQ